MSDGYLQAILIKQMIIVDIQHQIEKCILSRERNEIITRMS